MLRSCWCCFHVTDAVIRSQVADMNNFRKFTRNLSLPKLTFPPWIAQPSGKLFACTATLNYYSFLLL